LTLFNFDLIVPEQQQQDGEEVAVLHLRVVDINYLPGFDKVPGAQRLLGQYLRQRCEAAAAAAGGERRAAAGW